MLLHQMNRRFLYSQALTKWMLPGAIVDLNFAAGLYWPFDISQMLTVTRASNGYAQNANGTLTNFGNNVPRIGVGTGLLMEDPQTNLAFHSQLFQSAEWNSVNIFDTTYGTTTTAPDGTNTAQKLTENTTNSFHQVTQIISKSASPVSYTLSVFALAAERSRILLQIGDGSNGMNCTFDTIGDQLTSTGPYLFGTGFTLGATKIVPLGNGWVRVSITTTTASSTTLKFGFVIDGGTGSSADVSSYAGTNGFGIYIWGAQIEAAINQIAVGSSYIPTTAASATRSSDFVSLMGLARSVVTLPAASIIAKTIYVNPSNNDPRVVGDTSSAETTCFLDVPGSSLAGQFNGTNTIFAPGSFSLYGQNTMGDSWDGTGRSAVANNSAVTTDALAVGTIANTYMLGSQGGGSQFLDGYLSRLVLFNSRISDATLRGFTAPGVA